MGEAAVQEDERTALRVKKRTDGRAGAEGEVWEGARIRLSSASGGEGCSLLFLHVSGT